MSRVLLVTSGGRLFGLDLKAVCEVIKEPLLHDVPLAPASLMGVINVHDTVVPVVDFARLCGAADGAGRQMVILESPCLALAVTAVHGLCIPSFGMPGGLIHPWVCEAFICNRGVAGLIDVTVLQQTLQQRLMSSNAAIVHGFGG